MKRVYEQRNCGYETELKVTVKVTYDDLGLETITEYAYVKTYLDDVDDDPWNYKDEIEDDVKDYIFENICDKDMFVDYEIQDIEVYEMDTNPTVDCYMGWD